MTDTNYPWLDVLRMVEERLTLIRDALVGQLDDDPELLADDLIEDIREIRQSVADVSHDPRALAHSERFRKVSTRYPRRVAEAYGGDLKRAMVDTDEQVAATVVAWETRQGVHPVDWPAVGAAERDS
jgi:hypothetical protein